MMKKYFHSVKELVKTESKVTPISVTQLGELLEKRKAETYF